jgi:uncharacterized membrane protein
MYLTAVVDVLVLLVVQALMWAFAGLRRQTVRFGVRVPVEHVDGPMVRQARRVFRVGILADTVVMLPMVIFAGVTGRPLLILLVLLVAIVGDFAAFSAARRVVVTAKTAGRWYAGRRQVVAVDVAPRPALGGLRWSWLAQPVAVIAATAIVGAWRYPHLPARLVLHFDRSGTPDWTVGTSPGAAFLPVLNQVVLTAVLIAVAVAVLRMPAELDPADGGGAALAEQARARSERLAAALLTLGMCTNVSLALLAVQQWWGGTQLRWPLLIGALTATILGVVVVTWAALGGQADGSLLARDSGDSSAPVWRDDDRHWRGGLIYRNPDDPKLLVPKRFGIGLTFNFAHRMAWVYLAVLIALPIASFVLAALLGG